MTTSVEMEANPTGEARPVCVGCSEPLEAGREKETLLCPGCETRFAPEKPAAPILRVRHDNAPAVLLIQEPTSWVRCPLCAEEYRALGQSGACVSCEINAEDAAARQRRVDERMEAMMGQKGARLFTFEAYRQSEGTASAFAAMKNFTHTADNALLWGPAGTGKTHLAGALVRKTLSARGPAAAEFHKIPRLLRWFHLRKPSEQDAELDRLAKLEVLVLDDLGVEKDSEYNLGILYELLDARDMGDRNGLVVTSNLRPADLAEKMGDDRLPSRLFGMCKANVFELRAADARLDVNGRGK